MNYREKRKIAIQELFENFHLDLTGCRKPEQVKRIYELCLQGYYSYEIAEILGVTPKTVQKTYRRYNFPDMQNYFPPRLDERSNFVNGLKIDRSGHIYKRVPGHPHGSKWGSYVAVHRLVMEEHLGRYLTKEEVVHHKDGNPANNDLSNLELFASNAEHLAKTLKGHCPNWSPEGREKLKNQNKKRKRNNQGQFLNQELSPSHAELESDDSQ